MCVWRIAHKKVLLISVGISFYLVFDMLVVGNPCRVCIGKRFTRAKQTIAFQTDNGILTYFDAVCTSK